MMAPFCEDSVGIQIELGIKKLPETNIVRLGGRVWLFCISLPLASGFFILASKIADCRVKQLHTQLKILTPAAISAYNGTVLSISACI